MRERERERRGLGKNFSDYTIVDLPFTLKTLPEFVSSNLGDYASDKRSEFDGQERTNSTGEFFRRARINQTSKQGKIAARHEGCNFLCQNDGWSRLKTVFESRTTGHHVDTHF